MTIRDLIIATDQMSLNSRNYARLKGLEECEQETHEAGKELLSILNALQNAGAKNTVQALAALNLYQITFRSSRREKCGIMNLIKCQTISQFKIGAWLAAQGITDEEISSMEFLDRDTVKIYNPAGQFMIIHWTGDHAEIDTGPEVRTC